MEYSIREVAEMTGVSTRTLRYLWWRSVRMCRVFEGCCFVLGEI